MSDHEAPVTLRTADRLVEAMQSAGIRAVFSLSGNQIMPVYDALIGSGIRLIHSRHEAAAVFMAEAYARTAGQVGIALVTAGPGFGNALGALYSVTMSETPLVLISGDSPLSQDGQGAFQEFDQVAAATPFVKASLRLRAGIDVAEVLAMAMQIARQGTPGPVHIAVPFDVVNQLVDTEALVPAGSFFEPTQRDTPTSAPELSGPLAQLLSEADRPVIVCGAALGDKRLQEDIEKLRHAAAAPVIVLDSPRGVRDPAKGAFRSLLQAADCLVYIGKEVDFMTAMGSGEVIGAQRIGIISEQQSTLAHARDVYQDRLTVAELVNPGAAITALAAALEKIPRSSQRRQTAAAWLEAAECALHHRQLDNPTPEALVSRQTVGVINDFVHQHPETIVICDGGEFGQWAQGFIEVDRMITNGPSGAIGGSLPYAIGAAVASPDQTVIAVMGDGTAGFHFSEFETAAREQLKIIVIIGNDSKWQAEHHLQRVSYGDDRTMGCELSSNVRYDLSAEGMGCHGICVNDVADLGPALDAAIAIAGPVCINMLIPGAAAPVYKPYTLQ